MKCYIEIPILCKWNRRKFNRLPLGGGIYFHWDDYDFSHHAPDKAEGIFPYGYKEGKHLFTTTIGIMYFSISITLYKPKTNL